MKNTYAHLAKSLPGFVSPSTSSQKEGTVDEGYYLVLEVKENFTDHNTDYVRILAPHLGDNDTWICSRYKEERYAEIMEREIKMANIDQSNDPMAVDESELTQLLANFEGFIYDLDEARYPYPLDGVKLPMAPPDKNNCCTFVEALVVKAWQNVHNLEWNNEKHGQMMIFSAMDYYSPVTALLHSDVATVLNPDDAPAPWSVIQGWRNQWRSGHTFIILDYHPETDRVLTLESNASYKLNGVGFRQIGNLRDVEIDRDWWKNEDLWTWEKLKSTYRYRKLAALKVKNRTWTT